MSFLSGLMNIREVVEAGTEKPAMKPSGKQPNGDAKKGGKTRAVRCEGAYAELFATPATVGAASNARNISYVGCLNQVYRYEKRGLIKRVGTCDTYGRAILWQWIGELK